MTAELPKLTPPQRAAGYTVLAAFDPATPPEKKAALLLRVAQETGPNAAHSGAYIGAMVGLILCLIEGHPGSARDLIRNLRETLDNGDI